MNRTQDIILCYHVKYSPICSGSVWYIHFLASIHASNKQIVSVNAPFIPIKSAQIPKKNSRIIAIPYFHIQNYRHTELLNLESRNPGLPDQSFLEFDLITFRWERLCPSQNAWNLASITWICSPQDLLEAEHPNYSISVILIKFRAWPSQEVQCEGPGLLSSYKSDSSSEPWAMDPHTSHDRSAHTQEAAAGDQMS